MSRRPRARPVHRHPAGAGVVAVFIVAVLVALTGCTGGGEPAPSGTESTAAPQPAAVVTTADGTARLADLPVSVGAATSPASTNQTDDVLIRVAPSRPGQRITGFGAALTHASAAVLDTLPAGRRGSLMRELFDPTGPVRLSVLRIPIGASDFVPDRAFTLDDRPPGVTDWNLDHFSTAPDRKTLQPLLRQALAVNPHLVVIASPWSPPAWLKTSGSLEGGQLLDEQRAYDTYADYFTRFIRDYQEAGIPITAVTVQNEPQLRTPDGYPGTDMPVAQEARLIETLGPALRKAELDTDILGYDHNWTLAPGDAATTPSGRDAEREYPSDLLGTAAAPWISGTAFHCYNGDASAQTYLAVRFPTRSIWVTECSGSHSPDADAATVFSDTLTWQATNLLIPALRNRATTVLTFNLALDPDGGPHVGGCDTCTGVVTIGSDGAITRNAEYYLLAHAGRYLQRGAVEVAADAPPGGPILPVAFRNPNGSGVVVAWNHDDQPHRLVLRVGARTVTIRVPAHALASVRWR
ncbi:glycoside hydrolase family 30 beta sandwich domain-containing protein [Curtobacterium sp. MCPF17_002]|uniref:glycoside hydrolase family 30 protein n=1 Tax=Curtobacterium sp. MCPF17_002 TaxID=2175645 RepID=UPI0015E8E43E|nr:glycoside hydrolase family 30 beta sandwich domain-containing protein [Curtobacterium sp. MCPF17_002]WIB79155.1 glycoside hydrolase family 30 beta sandwich domain-containing protein [Curtobacterium sp. MCPF17_002]